MDSNGPPGIRCFRGHHRIVSFLLLSTTFLVFYGAQSTVLRQDHVGQHRSQHELVARILFGARGLSPLLVVLVAENWKTDIHDNMDEQH